MSFCSGHTAKGIPCKRPPTEGSTFCYCHDPALAAGAAKVNSSNASKAEFLTAREAPAAPGTITEVRDLVTRTMHWLLVGKVDHRRAAAVCALAKQAEKLFSGEGPHVAPDPMEGKTDEEVLVYHEQEAQSLRNKLAAARAPGNGAGQVTA